MAETHPASAEATGPNLQSLFFAVLLGFIPMPFLPLGILNSSKAKEENDNHCRGEKKKVHDKLICPKWSPPSGDGEYCTSIPPSGSQETPTDVTAAIPPFALAEKTFERLKPRKDKE